MRNGERGMDSVICGGVRFSGLGGPKNCAEIRLLESGRVFRK